MSEELSMRTKSTNNDVTIIQVDKDISFVLDTRDINYGVPASLQDRSSALSRKTYSKKYPVTCNPCVSYSDDSISVIGSTPLARGKKSTLKDSPKCTNSSLSPIKGKSGRKRPTDSGDGIPECPVHKKGRKFSPVARVAPTKINGCIISNKFKVPITKREDSPDSDIQIVEIVKQSNSNSGSDAFRSNLNDDVPRRKKQLTNSLKSLSSYSSNEDVPITEADTAPFMPSYSAMPHFNVSESSASFQSSMKWLSASGTLAFQNGGTFAANDPAMKFNDKFHLYFPEMKIPQNESVSVKKPKRNRELKTLYENLNEISWANEEKFKQLLSTNIDNRHSVRITEKVTAGKDLRKKNLKKLNITKTKRKPGLVKKSSSKSALNNSAKFCSLKPKLLIKTVPKQKVSFNKVNKVNKSPLKPKTISGAKTISKPNNKVQVIKRSVLKSRKGKVLKKSVIKSNKINVKKSIVKPHKTNITKSVIKSNVTKPVIKTDITKPVINTNVTKPVIKTNVTKPVIKTNVTKPVIKTNVTKPVIKSHVTKPVIKTNVSKPFIKSNVTKSIIKSNVKRPFIKSNARRPFIKSNVKRPFIKSSVKRPFIKSNVKRPFIKCNVKRPFIKSNVKRPVIKSNVKRPVIKSNIVRPLIKSNVSRSVIKSNVTRPVIKSNVTRPVIKSNVTKPLLKTNVTQSVPKPTKSILKSRKSLFKVRFKDVGPKNGPKIKSVAADKKKPLIAAVATCSKNLDAFSDSFQSSAGNCSHSADNGNSGLFSAFGRNLLQSDNFPELKNPSFVKELQKYDVRNEFQVLKHANSDKVLETAMKKGSKLRVTVEPIEHTKLWNADFFEAFKKHVLEQAFLQTFDRREQDSINNMFQELQDACFHPPNNVKSFKKKKTTDDEVPRSSVRQLEKGFGYKEIVVKRMDNYLQFVLLPHACKLNSLNIEAIKELKEAFIQAKKDPTCRAVLLNSSGTYFCTGIELSLLVGSNRKQIVEEMASSIRDLILTLSTFTKPIIAAVNGTAVGLGVALLTYCDVVLASDKATFCIPATRLGYLPEGGVTLTLPQVVGSGVATEMLLYGRRLTAEQALRHGLVSEVLWPTHLMNEVVPRMKTICSQPLQVMEATKTMVRCHLWDKLKTHMEREWRLLPPLWLDAQCQHKMKGMLETGWLVD